jgi:hypothetical protein
MFTDPAIAGPIGVKDAATATTNIAAKAPPCLGLLASVASATLPLAEGADDKGLGMARRPPFA